MGSDFLNRPTAIKPAIDRVSVALADTRELGCTKSLTTKLQLACVSAVSILFGRRCPSAVVWLIVASWVNAIKRVLVAGRWPHVIKKCTRRFAPSVAHSDTLAAVVSIVSAAWIVASPVHINPRLILAGFCFAVSAVALLATAALAFSDSRDSQEDRLAAITVAFPGSSYGSLEIDSLARFANNRERSISIPNHVNHGINYSIPGGET